MSGNGKKRPTYAQGNAYQAQDAHLAPEQRPLGLATIDGVSREEAARLAERNV